MKRKMAMCLAIVLGGAAGYLALSGAPWRLHFAELGFQLPFLVVGCWLSWRPGQRTWTGALYLALFVVTGSVARAALVNLALAKDIEVFSVQSIAAGVGLLSVELLVLVGLVAGLDRLIARSSRRVEVEALRAPD
jgi:hypothetical protein